jgi:hypothetical protein
MRRISSGLPKSRLSYTFSTFLEPLRELKITVVPRYEFTSIFFYDFNKV